VDVDLRFPQAPHILSTEIVCQCPSWACTISAMSWHGLDATIDTAGLPARQACGRGHQSLGLRGTWSRMARTTAAATPPCSYLTRHGLGIKAHNSEDHPKEGVQQFETNRPRHPSTGMSAVESCMPWTGGRLNPRWLLAWSQPSTWVLYSAAFGFPARLESIFQAHAAATTLAMVFVTQHTQARAQAATQRKLDEILLASPDADTPRLPWKRRPTTKWKGRPTPTGMRAVTQARSRPPERPNSSEGPFPVVGAYRQNPFLGPCGTPRWRASNRVEGFPRSREVRYVAGTVDLARISAPHIHAVGAH
jgi:hypothetical protein